MATTLPSPDRAASTRGEDLRAFDVTPAWNVPGPDEAPNTEGARPFLEHPVTTKQQFDPAEVARRRHLKQWGSGDGARFVLKQEWIGRVDEVREDTFIATLTSRDRPDDVDHAEIEIEEVAPKDLGMLRRGAIFYWVIGYRDEAYGQRLGVSSVLFRKMIEPTSEQLESATAHADQIVDFLDKAAPTGRAS